MASDLSARDLERAKFAFGVYDFDGSGVIDASNLGDLLHVIGCTPNLKLVEKVGGTKKKGEKKLKLEEFLPIYNQVKKDKDVGNFHDYTEVLRLYDKANDGKMPVAEFSHVLQSLGETLSKAEVESILKDCGDAEDDEGFFPYGPFLKRLLAGPFPESED